MINNVPRTKEKNNLFLLLITFLSIYLPSSFSLSQYTGTERLLMYLAYAVLMVVYLLLRYGGTLRLPIYCIIPFILILMVSLLNQSSIKSILIITAYYVTAILFVCVVKREIWIKYYQKVMCILAVFSIIAFVLVVFFPDIIRRLPTTVNGGQLRAYTMFFAVVPTDLQLRSFGLFWEPGAHQVYLSLAVMFEFFCVEKTNTKRLFLYIVALCLTFSTAAYFVLLAIVVAVLFNGLYASKERKKSIYFLLALLIPIIIAYYVIMYFDPSLYYTVFGKLEHFTADSSHSAGIRYSSIEGTIQALWQSPIWGWGQEGLKTFFENTYNHKMNTFTPGNWFAENGIFYGTVMCIGLFKFTQAFSKRTFMRFLLFIILLMMLAAEDFASNVSVLIWIMYGLKGEERKEVLN